MPDSGRENEALTSENSVLWEKSAGFPMHGVVRPRTRRAPLPTSGSPATAPAKSCCSPKARIHPLQRAAQEVMVQLCFASALLPKVASDPGAPRKGRGVLAGLRMYP